MEDFCQQCQGPLLDCDGHSPLCLLCSGCGPGETCRVCIMWDLERFDVVRRRLEETMCVVSQGMAIDSIPHERCLGQSASPPASALLEGEVPLAVIRARGRATGSSQTVKISDVLASKKSRNNSVDCRGQKRSYSGGTPSSPSPSFSVSRSGDKTYEMNRLYNKLHEKAVSRDSQRSNLHRNDSPPRKRVRVQTKETEFSAPSTVFSSPLKSRGRVVSATYA